MSVKSAGAMELNPLTSRRSQPHASTDEFNISQENPQYRGTYRQASAPAGMHHGVGVKGKLNTIGRAVKRSTANFFGIGEEDTFNSDKWEYRRVKMLNKKTGNVTDHRFKQQSLSAAPSADMTDSSMDPLARQMSTATAASFRRQMRQKPQGRTKKDSVLRMAVDTMKKPKQYKRTGQLVRSRTFAPASVAEADEGFDMGIVSPPATAPPGAFLRMQSTLTEDLEDEVFFDFTNAIPPATPGGKTPLVHIPEDEPLPQPVPGGWGKPRRPPQPRPSTPGVDTVDGIGMRRILENVMDKVQDNSDRRRYGMGFVGRICGRKLKKDESLSRQAQKELDAIEDQNFRPYFTYWVTFVQIVIYIVSVSVYGIAPVGFEQTLMKDEVIMPNLAIEQSSYYEKDNLWIGPREADLIHLGAKYSPCMRRDLNVYKAIEQDHVIEGRTACCVRNDGSGCVQSSKIKCSPTLSTWHKWSSNGTKGHQDRASGSVCGQDSKYCKKPMSIAPYQWQDDITKWPICLEAQNVSKNVKDTPQMTCELLGHPCCSGIQGECIITTRDYCDFIKGYFHEEAYLCSQVKCLKEICGMIPFGNADVPDQIYRFWTSLFLSAGLFHLLVTILFQILVMRDLEKMAGPIRIATIYMASGVAGNLGSAIFLPYLVETGPAGCQFGVLACLLVEYISNWQRIEKPWKGVGKMIGVMVVLFLAGLLPWIDNYAHMFGFIFGLLLSFLLLPFVTFGKKDRRNRIITIVVCSLAVVGLFTLLILLFYVVPIYECKGCSYFTCIPFTPKFCENMGVEIRRVESDI